MAGSATVRAQMLIRRPLDEVFRAFTDPVITTRFWFTHSSGKLEEGKTVTWKWEMYGVEAIVLVKELVPGKVIRTEWGNPSTNVDYLFEAMNDNSTYVVIKNYGFHETGDDLLNMLVDSTGGFTTVLDGLKAYLEHGIMLNLIKDKFPHGTTI